MKYHISYFLSNTLITDLHSNEFLNAFGCKHGNFLRKIRNSTPVKTIGYVYMFIFVCSF